MRSYMLIGSVALVLGTAAGSLWGDIPGPGPRPPRPRHDAVPQMADVPPPNATRIVVEVSKEVTHPRLVIPKPLLERVPPHKETIGPVTFGFRIPSLDHLLFALVLAMGGLYLLRGRVRLAFATVMLLAIGVTLGLGRSCLEAADAGIPPLPLPHHSYAKEVARYAGKVVLEDLEIVVSPDWGEVKLTLPPSAVPELKR